MDETEENRLKTHSPLRSLICVAAASAIFVAIWSRRFRLNGTDYHRWVWRESPGGWRYALFAGLSLPFFAAQCLIRRRPHRSAVALALMMLTSASLMGAMIILQQQPASLGGITRVIESPIHFGYFYDAERLLEKGISPAQTLADYPRLCGSFSLHPRIKPPGPILLNSLVISLFGPERPGELAIAILIGLCAAASIPAVYFFVSEFTGDVESALAAASYFALCPALLLMFPQFDQCYALLTAALAIIWRRALARNSAYLAGQFGLIFAMALLFTYLPAVLVIFFGGYALIRRSQGEAAWHGIARLTIVAMICFAAFYAVLWLATGFNPINSFRACWANQALNMRLMQSLGYLPRLWPGTTPGDFKDFALGSGWISYLIAAMFFVHVTAARRRVLILAALCLGQVIAVGLLGLIRCETTRVWIFMLPLLMLPVGVELARWRFAWRLGVYAALLALTIASWHSMTFFR
jgi:hypothetical protein